jgi:hypothetical protein
MQTSAMTGPSSLPRPPWLKRDGRRSHRAAVAPYRGLEQGPDSPPCDESGMSDIFHPP